jgi:hypothetical protein
MTARVDFPGPIVAGRGSVSEDFQIGLRALPHLRAMQTTTAHEQNRSDTTLALRQFFRLGVTELQRRIRALVDL